MRSSFLFLSGYGLYISYNSFTKKVINSKNKYNIKYDFVFVKNHLLKLMSNYWIIYIIFVSFFIISRIPIISKLLEVLGKHSGAIFMFHTFIFTYYFEDFFYSFNNPLLIFLVTVIICLMISILISFIKRITCYDKLIKYLTQTKI